MHVQSPPLAANAQGRLTRSYFWGTVMIGLVLFAISWVSAAAFSGDAYERLFAFFASFGASAIWWAFLARVAEREIFALVREQLSAERERAERAREVEIELLKAELDQPATVGDDVPAAVYPGKTGADLRFNHDLDEHLEATTRYLFHGPTAVYVGARVQLRENKRMLQLVQVKITDPTSDVALRHAVDDRLRRPDHIDKQPAEVETELRDDIYMAIIALFDARSRAQTVRVLHERRAAGVRVELFDAALYDSTVHSSERKNFTHTLQWENAQATYKAHERRMRESTRDSSRSVTFTSGTREIDLLSHLEALGMEPNRLEDLRSRYGEAYVLPLTRVLRRARGFSEELTDDE